MCKTDVQDLITYELGFSENTHSIGNTTKIKSNEILILEPVTFLT